MLKKFKYLSLVLAIISALGCSAKKVPTDWVAVDGSKSDGVVLMGYTWGILERPVVNPEQATQIATEKCRSWGYEGAEPFGAMVKKCVSWNQYGCYRWGNFTKYQCTGNRPNNY